MIYVSSIEALDQELPWEAEVLTNLQSLLVDVFCRKVFSDATIVGIAKLYFIVFMIEKVVYVHIVDITLYVFEVNIRLFVSLATSHSTFVLVSIFLGIFVFFFLFI